MAFLSEVVAMVAASVVFAWVLDIRLMRRWEEAVELAKEAFRVSRRLVSGAGAFD